MELCCRVEQMLLKEEIFMYPQRRISSGRKPRSLPQAHCDGADLRCRNTVALGLNTLKLAKIPFWGVGPAVSVSFGYQWDLLAKALEQGSEALDTPELSA